MSKVFARLLQTKVYAKVIVEITKVDVQVEQPESMMVSWKRGPQVSYSAKFEVNPKKQSYSVPHKFNRASTLFRDKEGNMQKKDSTLTLLCVSNGVQ